MMEMQPLDVYSGGPPGADSRYGYQSEWELFTLFPNDLSREKTVILNFSPIAPLRPGCPIEFNIMPNTMMYIDLKNIKLYLRVKLTKADGTNIDKGEDVGLVNYPIASLFRQVDLYIQQQIVCSTSTSYPYKAMLDVLMEADTEEIEGPLRQGLFVRDTPGKMDSASLTTDRNSGFCTRADFSAESGIFELQGKLHIDLCRQERLLLSCMQVTIKLSQSSDEFRIMRPPTAEGGTDKEYRVEIVQATLKVPFAKPTPPMAFGHEDGLKKNTAKYPFDRTEIKTMVIPAGVTQWPLDNLFLSAQPKRLVVGLVPLAAYNGDYTRNPFNFHHYGANYLCLSVDGTCVPTQAFQPDYDNKIFLEPYDSLFSIAPDERIGRPRKFTTIRREDYMGGYCLYAFNLDGGTLGSNVRNPQSIGLSKMDLRFASRLTEPVCTVLYPTFNALLLVDKNRNIKVVG